ncbi:signal peptidase II [Sphingomonas sanguinis]|nr:signal peptidase II [Sphingomonas sanguinis]
MNTGRAVSTRFVGMSVAVAAFLLDQISKWLVTYPAALRSREVIDLIPFFSLRWAENYGVSLSYLQADSDLARWALVAFTSVIAGGVAIWLLMNCDPINGVGLGLILGGALGNIADRTRLGHVVDFLDLHFGGWRPFAIFNVADCMISIGVIVLLLSSWASREKHSRSNPLPN